jgi:hypothetical protein
MYDQHLLALPAFASLLMDMLFCCPSGSKRWTHAPIVLTGLIPDMTHI